MKTLTGRLILTALCFVWALAATVPAQAQGPSPQEGTLSVEAFINGVCAVGGPTSGATLNFGNIVTPGGITAAISGSTTFTVNCSDGLPYVVNLGAGMHAPPGSASRGMAGPAGNPLLLYQLYHAAPTAELWGTAFTGGMSFGQTGTGGDDTWTVFGQIPVQAGPFGSGSYMDSVTITVTF